MKFKSVSWKYSEMERRKDPLKNIIHYQKERKKNTTVVKKCYKE